MPFLSSDLFLSGQFPPPRVSPGKVVEGERLDKEWLKLIFHSTYKQGTVHPACRVSGAPVYTRGLFGECSWACHIVAPPPTGWLIGVWCRTNSSLSLESDFCLHVEFTTVCAWRGCRSGNRSWLLFVLMYERAAQGTQPFLESLVVGVGRHAPTGDSIVLLWGSTLAWAKLLWPRGVLLEGTAFLI